MSSTASGTTPFNQRRRSTTDGKVTKRGPLTAVTLPVAQVAAEHAAGSFAVRTPLVAVVPAPAGQVLQRGTGDPPVAPAARFVPSGPGAPPPLRVGPAPTV